VSRVEINSNECQVVVDHDGELAHLATTALDLWTKTVQPTRLGPGSAGFQMERRGTYDVAPSTPEVRA
jgi:hypothetical protein